MTRIDYYNVGDKVLKYFKELFEDCRRIRVSAEVDAAGGNLCKKKNYENSFLTLVVDEMTSYKFEVAVVAKHSLSVFADFKMMKN